MPPPKEGPSRLPNGLLRRPLALVPDQHLLDQHLLDQHLLDQHLLD